MEDIEKHKACFLTEFLLDLFRRTLEHIASDCPASNGDTFESQKWLKANVCQEFHEYNFHLRSEDCKWKICIRIKTFDYLSTSRNIENPSPSAGLSR